MPFTPLIFALAIVAQEPKDTVPWRAVNTRNVLSAVALTGVAAVYDERIARWTRTPGVHGDTSRARVVRALTVVNEMPLTVGAVVTYGVGRLTGSRTVADVGAHLTESLVVTEVIAETVRSGLGRARPRASPDDAFAAKPGKGLTQFEYRSFPSLHAAVAFTTAAALGEEMRIRQTRGRRYLTPLLYTLAAVPGFTRLYLDQHWASDIIAGTALGAFVGARVVRYGHGRERKLDRWLLGSHVVFVPNTGIFCTFAVGR